MEERWKREGVCKREGCVEVRGVCGREVEERGCVEVRGVCGSKRGV